MVENSVIDYDNLTFEILKAHAISFAYLGIVWFQVKFREQEHNHKDMLLYTRRPQQVIRFLKPFVQQVLTMLFKNVFNEFKIIFNKF